MDKYNKKIFIFFLSLFILVFNFSQTTNSAYAGSFMNGLKNTAGSAGYTSPNASFGTKTPEQIIALVIKVLLSVIGVILLALLLYGGFIWMNAKGNQSDTQKAQDIIRNAIIGIIIVLAAYAISSLVYSKLQGQ